MSEPTVTIHKTGALGKTETILPLVPRHGDRIDRRDLTDPTEIIERMARDILAARREGNFGLIDLTDHGWTQAQAMRHGATARDLAASPAFATHDVVVRMLEQEAAEIARLAQDRAEPFAGGTVIHVSTPSTGDMATMIDDLGGAA